MTDYLWEEEECKQQKEDTISYKNGKFQFFNATNKLRRERDRRKKVNFILFYIEFNLLYLGLFCLQELNQNLNINRQKFHNLITSLAMPAFDKKTQMVS